MLSRPCLLLALVTPAACEVSTPPRDPFTDEPTDASGVDSPSDAETDGPAETDPTTDPDTARHTDLDTDRDADTARETDPPVDTSPPPSRRRTLADLGLAFEPVDLTPLGLTPRSSALDATPSLNELILPLPDGRVLSMFHAAAACAGRPPVLSLDPLAVSGCLRDDVGTEGADFGVVLGGRVVLQHDGPATVYVPDGADLVSGGAALPDDLPGPARAFVPTPDRADLAGFLLTQTDGITVHGMRLDGDLLVSTGELGVTAQSVYEARYLATGAGTGLLSVVGDGYILPAEEPTVREFFRVDAAGALTAFDPIPADAQFVLAPGAGVRRLVATSPMGLLRWVDREEVLLAVASTRDINPTFIIGGLDGQVADTWTDVSLERGIPGVLQLPTWFDDEAGYGREWGAEVVPVLFLDGGAVVREHVLVVAAGDDGTSAREESIEPGDMGLFVWISDPDTGAFQPAEGTSTLRPLPRRPGTDAEQITPLVPWVKAHDVHALAVPTGVLLAVNTFTGATGDRLAPTGFVRLTGSGGCVPTTYVPPAHTAVATVTVGTTGGVSAEVTLATGYAGGPHWNSDRVAPVPLVLCDGLTLVAP